MGGEAGGYRGVVWRVVWVCETGAAIGMPPRARDRGEDGLKLGEASAGRDGDGGESAESQEGEFGAEVSAFLSGAACVWVSACMYVRVSARARGCARSRARCD